MTDDMRDQIRDIFLAHGFTIKDGCDDLKPYVYEAAEALLRLAAQPPQAPPVRQTERLHGIGIQPDDTNGTPT